MSNVLELTAYKNGEYMPLKDIGPSILDFGFIDKIESMILLFNSPALNL